MALIRSAHSSNIKERRDASTALFDGDGQMVMQAEHIPVHLGSMPAAVAAVLGERHAPGVSWILNDPFAGGTHLPDITVITPVFDGAGPLLGFAASRAHHADVGGRVPGSMPADSHTLAEEGVVISPRSLDDAAIDELVARMRQPRRAPRRPARAAGRQPHRRAAPVRARRAPGRDRLRAAIDAVLDYAERRTRACLAELPDGERNAEDLLEAREGDLVLRLRAHVQGDAADARLRRQRRPARGQPQLPARRHAVGLPVRRARAHRSRHPAVGRRLSAGRGARARGLAAQRAAGAAVAAGNVETSSRVADLVLGAFGRALGQGTMNNLTLGAGCGDGESASPTTRHSAAARARAPTPTGPARCTSP